MIKWCFFNPIRQLPMFLCDSVGQVVLQHRCVVIGTASLLFIAYRICRAAKRRLKRTKWNSVEKDVIVLHGLDRSRSCPNLSPFVLKLETYIRMAGLKYQYDSSEPKGPKGKTPWITINGEEIGDSHLIIEFLAKKFNLDFAGDLTAEQKGISRALAVMVDEHLQWGIGDWRYLRDTDVRILDLMNYPNYYRHFMYFRRKRFRSRALDQGLGVHSGQEIEAIMVKDIEAISSYLGDKLFLMGDEPSEVDCSVFGTLAQIVWGTPGSLYASLVQTDYRNLMMYCFRMKEMLYPDWDKLLLDLELST